MKNNPPGPTLLLAVSIAAAVTCACASRVRTAENLNRDGNRQYAAGDYGPALETYRRAEVLRPDLPALNYNAANALNRQSDFARALAEGQRAVHSTDPAVQDRAYYGMGDAYVHTNQLREAVDAYKSALRANPSDVDAKYNLEVIQRRLDQDEARRQQTQQQEQGQANQSGDTGQPEEGQQGQAQAGAEGQDGQPAAGQAEAGQGGQPAPSAQGSSGASGYTGTPAGQAESLFPNLKRALDQFNQTGNVDDALRALDIVGQQERLRQGGNGAPPQSQGRDW